MIRTELKRKTPLKNHKPMARGTSYLRAHKPKAAKPKRAAREAQDKHLADMCRGQDCYLHVLIAACEPYRKSVPCHSNQSRHGKGMGLKAEHQFTVPGCPRCHYEIDQGMRLTKEEKFAIWDAAYAKWESVRAALLQQCTLCGGVGHSAQNCKWGVQ